MLAPEIEGVEPVDDLVKGAVEIDGIVKSYNGGATAVLRGVSLEIPLGGLVVILGPSGCGKTTLLRILAGLQTADEGRIQVGSDLWLDVGARVHLPPEQRNIGMVFQNYALWPHWTVGKNVAFPLEARNVPKKDRPAIVRQYLDLVGCGPLVDRLPSQLSGGQQQRVALARALVTQPSLLLLDEPLSSIDTQLRSSLRQELRRLHRELGFTALLVTHDQDEALELATVIVVMRDGQVVQVGPPEEIVNSPASPYVAEFFGMTNVVRGEWAERVAGVVGGPSGLELCFRPTAARVLGESDGVIDHITVDEYVFGGAIVMDSTTAHDGRRYLVEWAGHNLVVGKGGRHLPADVSVGSPVRVTVPRSQARLFRDGIPVT